MKEPSPSPFNLFLLPLKLSRNNSIGNACRAGYYERASDFSRMSLILSTGHASGGFAVLRRGRKGIRELRQRRNRKGMQRKWRLLRARKF